MTVRNSAPQGNSYPTEVTILGRHIARAELGIYLRFLSSEEDRDKGRVVRMTIE